MQSKQTNKLAEQATNELQTVLKTQQKFVKAHAAEYLIWTGHREEALKAFLKEDSLYSSEPKYRVVVWRVLVEAEKSNADKKAWLQKIYGAYTDMNGPDRTHATETLAKLKQPVNTLFPQVTAKTLVAEDSHLQTYTIWASSVGSENLTSTNREKLLKLALTDTSNVIRRISAFAIRKIKGLDISQWQRVEKVALKTSATEDLFVPMLTTALITAPAGANKEKLQTIKSLLMDNVTHYSVAQLNELSLALAEKGKKNDLPVLQNLLDNKNNVAKYDSTSAEAADLRAAAAYAILEIIKRVDK